MHLKTTRSRLVPGDVFYWDSDPEYVYEVCPLPGSPGRLGVYEIGDPVGQHLTDVRPDAKIVVIIHNTREARNDDSSRP